MLGEQRLVEGMVIDGYRLDKRLHVGGMAAIWQVTHEALPQPAIMKTPILHDASDPTAIVSFEVEQMILPMLSGPHVPKFIAAGGFEQQPYIVMELIAGDSLRPRLDEAPLPPAEVAAIGARIAEALHDLHRQHVIHLDLKPSNVMFRTSGEAVLVDFGLARHDRLPDLLAEEFRLPMGTGPYISPEQVLRIRNDPRSDLFSLGVLLYFFTTGERPFGEGETLRAMRRRLWRDPHPPRALRADYPPWLQEVVLRCLEIEPVRRYPTASQLAFDLTHPDQVRLTTRSERMKRDPLGVAWRRRFNQGVMQPRAKSDVAAQIASSPILAVALDTAEGAPELNEALRVTTERILATLPSARLACLNVLKLNRIAIDRTLDEQGSNKHIDRLVALRHWATPLKLDESRLSAHVLEAVDPAAAILEFAEVNHVDHVIIGARQGSFRRTLLGSVSAKVAAEAACTVTVVRPPRMAGDEADAGEAAG